MSFKVQEEFAQQCICKYRYGLCQLAHSLSQLENSFPFLKCSVPPSWNLLLNVFGRIRVSTQNPSAFLIDPFVRGEALVRAHGRSCQIPARYLNSVTESAKKVLRSGKGRSLGLLSFSCLKYFPNSKRI